MPRGALLQLEDGFWAFFFFCFPKEIPEIPENMEDIFWGGKFQKNWRVARIFSVIFGGFGSFSPASML